MQYISVVSTEMKHEFYKERREKAIQNKNRSENVNEFIEKDIYDIKDELVDMLDESKFYISSILKDFSLCLDISEINDVLSKTFLYYIIPAFEIIQRGKTNISNITKVIVEYLPEGNKILKMIENRICIFNDISCLNDKGKLIWLQDKFGLYNPGIILISLMKVDEEIKKITDASNLSSRNDNYIALINIQESITYLNHGLVSVLFDNYGYKYSSISGYALLNNAYLQNLLHDFKIFYGTLCDDLSKSFVEDNIEIVNMLYEYTKREIDLKCNSIRLQFAELFYMHSPFIDNSRKEDIGKLFDILWKVTCDAEIAKVYIEENEYEPQKNVESIGRNDHTTRIHIIFSLENQDIYSLRIDMPHKGVDYIHINLQEISGKCVKESAMPIIDDELLKEIKELLGENIKKFFYQAGDQIYWFRINYLDLIEKIEDERLSYRLREIFEKQKHFEINFTNNGYELFNDFKYYLKIFLSNSVQTTEKIDIATEIVLYRCVIWAREMLEICLFKMFKKSDVIIKAGISRIKKELIDIWNFFSEEDINDMYWVDVLELLADF